MASDDEAERFGLMADILEGLYGPEVADLAEAAPDPDPEPQPPVRHQRALILPERYAAAVPREPDPPAPPALPPLSITVNLHQPITLPGAPTVHVDAPITVDMPEQAPPQVTVVNKLSPAPPTPAGAVKFTRDDDGKITGARLTE